MQSNGSNSNESQIRARRALAQYLEGLQRAGLSIAPKVPEIAPCVATGPAYYAAGASPARPAAPVPAARPSPPPAAVAPRPSSELEMPRPKSTPASTPAPGSQGAAASQGAAGASKRNLETLLHLTGSADRQSALHVINNEVRGCTACPALVANRTQTVFGVGNVDTRLCFFGEAPGADEDKQGEPFVGRAGELLNKIIEAMTLKREEIFILNVLKCRPPANRPPEEDEVANCRHFFERQLAIIKPEFICCLGASAAKALLNTNFSIGKLRGRFYEYNGAQVIATYHPAYLLRNPGAKKDVWEDMKLLMKEMGLASSG